MCRFSCYVQIAFIECMIAGKTLLDLFSPNGYQKIGKIICISNLKTNMGKENVSLDFRQKKDETNYVLEEIMI